MSELNNIDRLFKEKFKDFEVTPSDKVWENIQSKMNTQDKEIKLLPLWLRLCSFIAVFLIGFSVATTFIAGPFGITNPLNKDSKNKPYPKAESNAIGIGKENTTVSSDPSNSNTIKQNNTVVVGNDENTILSGSKSLNVTPREKKGEDTTKEEEILPHNRLSNQGNTAPTTKKRALQKNNTAVSESSPKDKEAGALASRASKTEISADSNEKNQSILTPETKLTQKAVSTAADAIHLQDDSLSEITEYEDSDTYDANFDPYTHTSKVAYEVGNKYIQNKEVANRNIMAAVKTVDTKENLSAIPANNRIKSSNGKSNYTFKENSTSVTDTLTAKQNKIAEGAMIKKETEEKDSKDKNEKKTKWIVSTNFSPVYMNLNGYGSALDPKFDDNSKSYQTSMSYGVGLKYAIDKKWSVRTGVNVLNFDYNTNDISYYQSSNSGGLEYVNENANGAGVVIENPILDPKGIAHNENGIVTKQFSGNLNHKINYVEVPVEVTYKVLDRKFGIEVIGGLSSLIMNDNKVSLVSSDSNLVIGEANNLNKLHFSTNVGLGLHYSFMKNLHANVEPMLKYQINTYNVDAVDFKPYFIGIYSGISFSF